jgi:hypothetical protein
MALHLTARGVTQMNCGAADWGRVGFVSLLLALPDGL